MGRISGVGVGVIVGEGVIDGVGLGVTGVFVGIGKGVDVTVGRPASGVDQTVGVSKIGGGVRVGKGVQVGGGVSVSSIVGSADCSEDKLANLTDGPANVGTRVGNSVSANWQPPRIRISSPSIKVPVAVLHLGRRKLYGVRYLFMLLLF